MPDSRDKGFFASVFGLFGNYLRVVGQALAALWEYIRVPEKRRKVLSDLWQFSKALLSRIKSESIFTQAGSLTYITILGFVPFIVFIIMIAPNLPSLNLKDKIFATISNNFMPTSAMAINNIIEGVLSKQTGLNIFSLIILIISSYSLFSVIRGTFDRILSLKETVRLGFLHQLIDFLGTTILGVVIMLVMFSSTSLPLVSHLLKFPAMRLIMLILPFVMQFIGILFLYMLMPSLKLSRQSVVRGAFWTTIVWLLVKSGFDFYIYRMTNLQAVYGVLAGLPILLMWIYVNWVIILGGIAMIAVFENKDVSNGTKKDDRKLVRVTMDIYGGSKMVKHLEKKMDKDEVKNLMSDIGDEEE
jgi:membrane protein